ncbi:MAG: hypothetical protein ABL933_11445 [Methyloglobulus sp.]|nr:hypothetical protein [Methyloglobulus sp.]
MKRNTVNKTAVLAASLLAVAGFSEMSHANIAGQTLAAGGTNIDVYDCNVPAPGLSATLISAAPVAANSTLQMVITKMPGGPGVSGTVSGASAGNGVNRTLNQGAGFYKIVISHNANNINGYNLNSVPAGCTTAATRVINQ